ncbi:MAG: hypothetical protein GDA48_04510 [Hormoscilla sp. GM102CHS1]|nr:hypothetical protein [Hormoscilla sp. GM102CHS1]
MTRLVHDQFAKQYLSELLNLLGEVEISKEITSEVRQIDVFFIPAADAASKAEQIGLLDNWRPKVPPVLRYSAMLSKKNKFANVWGKCMTIIHY